MNASIIIPAYKPDKETLDKVVKSVKSQKIEGKFELIIVDKGWGFSKQMNYGIHASKYEFIIMLPQDCIPIGEDWLQNLLEPFKDKDVIATVSKVQFPETLWKDLDIFAKSLTVKEAGTITSLLDGKGSAYRKDALEKIGLFDEVTFRTAGEDFDTYVKLRKLGKISYPNSTILHVHPTNFIKRLRKDYQYANGYGALVKIHRGEMHHWYVGVAKALPLFGLAAFVAIYPLKKWAQYFLPYIVTIIPGHIFYVYGFWKGFINGKQTV